MHGKTASCAVALWVNLHKSPQVALSPVPIARCNKGHLGKVCAKHPAGERLSFDKMMAGPGTAAGCVHAEAKHT